MSLSVLLIEDVQAEADLVKAYLSKSLPTAKTHHVQRLHDGLEHLHTSHHDVVLLDLTLPDSAGVDTAKTLLSRFHDIPVIVLTGGSNPDLDRDLIQLGVQDFISKDRLDDYTLSKSILYAVDRQKVRSLLDQQIKKVMDAEHQLNRLIRSNSDGVLVLSKAGLVLYANPAAELLFGRSSADFVGTVIGLPAVSSETKEVDLRIPNGRQATLEMRVGSITWNDADGFLVSIRDITQRKAAQDVLANTNLELHKANEELKKLDQLKSEFTSILSHELRTPISVILGALSNLQDGILGTLTIEQTDTLKMITEQTERLSLLVADIMDLSRLESGKMDLVLAETHIVDLVKSATDKLRAQAAHLNIKLTVEDRDGLPSILCDRDRIGQVVQNLISNALKFTKAKGSIRLSFEHILPTIDGREWLVVGVHDTGIGIPEEKVSMIFDTYSQVEESSIRTVGGMGLGLSICKGIVQAHSGMIWVESELDRGSSFFFKLPVGIEHHAPEILVVDTDSTFLEMIEHYLHTKHLECDLYLANNGYDACLKLGSISPKVIITSLHMPQFDGIELYDRVKETQGFDSVHFVFVASHMDAATQARLDERNIQHIFTKPLDMDSLFDVIFTFL